MKEKPILFSAPMVRAILEGRKTQTRRIDKYMAKFPPAMPPELGLLAKSKNGEPLLTATWDATNGKFTASFCPYGQPGDRLWVRETHFINHFLGAHTPEIERARTEIIYRATDENYVLNMEDSEGLVWKPSIHMPYWASRINLEITGARVERLNDISLVDVIAEGIPELVADLDGTDSYKSLWESINGPGSWDANPWVWVIEFKRVSP